MKALNQITACVIDNGLFLSLAQRLARDYGRVLYWAPWETGFPRLNDCVIGDGFGDIERIDDFWTRKSEIDLFVFPDIQRSGLQLELESQGFPVWGSRTSDQLEMFRTKFLHKLVEVGLNAPPYIVVEGLSALRDHLRDKTDKYIKISKFRGSMETWHWIDWPQSRCQLDQLGVEFGPAQDQVNFLVFDNIETDTEVGSDQYCVDGRYPQHIVNGFEEKDKGFMCRVMPFKQLPVVSRRVLEAWSPVLAEHRHRNFFSTEIRRVSDQEFYFIDPCHRCPSPATEAQLELYENLGEIIAAGAEGELVEPVIAARYAAEVALTMKREHGQWSMVEVPDILWPWVKFRKCAMVDGLVAFPPSDLDECEVGWLVGLGDQPDEPITMIKKLISHVPDALHAHLESLANLLAKIKSSEEQGVPFSTGQPLPKPSIVVDET